MKNRQLVILASASPRRKELLEKAGIRFEIIPSQAEEISHSADPAEHVMDLARQKAEDIRKRLVRSENAAEDSMKICLENRETDDHVYILAADTIVVYDNRILGKPRDREDAVRTLMMLQNRTHQVYTGVCLLELADGRENRNLLFTEKTDVSFYPVSEEKIRRYVATGDALDKAGSYGIQGPWCCYVRGITGDYCNVVGLPLARLVYEAEKTGIQLFPREAE